MTNFRKNPPNQLIQAAAQRQAQRAASLLARSLPASLVSMEGRIATVKIEAISSSTLPLLSVPVAECEYVRAPLQPGCKGLLIGADISLGEVSGLGSVRPHIDDSSPNLSAAVFVPLSHKNWQNMDGAFLNLYGVRGVKLQESPGGGASITLSGGQVMINGTLIINGQPYLAHTHSKGHEGAPTGGVIA